MIKKEETADVFSYMDNDTRQVLINSLAKQEITSIIDSMFADDAADLLGDMPANVVTKLLENVDSETRADINHLLKYPDDGAGSIMTVEFIELKVTMTVKEFRVALVVSAVLALANGLRILLMYKNVSLALVMSLSLVGTIVIAKMVGCILPVLAKLIKHEPAIMAAPLITTVVDTFSIIIYFNIASSILHL